MVVGCKKRVKVPLSVQWWNHGFSRNTPWTLQNKLHVNANWKSTSIGKMVVPLGWFPLESNPYTPYILDIYWVHPLWRAQKGGVKQLGALHPKGIQLPLSSFHLMTAMAPNGRPSFEGLEPSLVKKTAPQKREPFGFSAFLPTVLLTHFFMFFSLWNDDRFIHQRRVWSTTWVSSSKRWNGHVGSCRNTVTMDREIQLKAHK